MSTSTDTGDATDGEQGEHWKTEQIARRLADADLFDLLAEVKFEGPDYRRFEEELASYGLAVTRAWIATGKMFAACLRQGFPIGPRPQHIDQDDIDSLAADTVFKALEIFRIKAQSGDGWRPDGGASLKTYFINGCVFAFLNQYQSWCRRQRRMESPAHEEPSEQDFVDHQPAVDPEARAIEKDQARRVYRNIDNDRDRLLLIWHSMGYTPAEIAELLADDSSPNTIRQRIRRLHGRLREDGDDSAGPNGKRGMTS